MADLSDFLSQQAMRPTYREIISSSTPAVLVRVSDGMIIDCSPIVCSMFGYLDDELIGHTVMDLMPKEFRERHLQHLQHYAKDPHVRSMGDSKMDLYGLSKKGEQFRIEIILVPSYKLGYLSAVATILKRRPENQ